MRRVLSKHRLSLLLTIVALLLWSYSILRAELEIGRFGLISSLPATFYVSLVALTAASALLWTSKQRSLLPLLQLLFLIVALYLTPYLLERTPRFVASYQSPGFIEYVTRTGEVNPQDVWYHSWPGFSVLFACLFQVSGIDDPMPTMALFPTFFMMLSIAPLFLLFQDTTALQHRRWCIVTWIMCIANWADQTTFLPQALAYLLLLYALGLALRTQQEGAKHAGYLVMLTLVITSLAITHLLTSVVCFLTLAGLGAVWKRPNISLVSILPLALILAWMLSGGSEQFDHQIPKFFTAEAFRLDAFLDLTYVYRITETSTDHRLINIVRTLFTAIFLFLALAGGLLARDERRLSRTNLSFMVIGGAPIMLLPAFMYGGEMLMRVFLMMLMPVGFFGSNLARGKVSIFSLVAILAICLPLHFLAHYGNEAVEYVAPAQIRATEFYFSWTSRGRLLGPVPPVYYKGIPEGEVGEGEHEFVSLFKNRRGQEPLSLIYERRSAELAGLPQYVCLTRSIDVRYGFINAQPDEVDDAEDWLDKSPRYDLIYDSENVAFYAWE